ncbi:hypothetical protein AGMMS50267_15720 [Spirochaetia bacterium]|nr:hypothetical protein AGMMS50267_15720 [Spirochaetia bacterium]
MKKNVTRKNRKTTLLVTAAVCLLAGAGIFVAGRFVTDTIAANKTYDGRKPAGTVNGEPFFQEDVDVYGAELRAAVAIHYGKLYNLSGMGADFWDTKYSIGTPREFQYNLALKDLARNMVLIQEARRRGIDAPASYHDLEDERADWNTRTDEDEIVYGPKELGPAEFNSYRITGIRDELKTALLQKELKPTVAQLRTAWASLPDGMKIAPFLVSGAVFKWNADGPSPEDDIRAALRRGLSPEYILGSLAASYRELTQESFEIDSRYISKEDEYDQERAAALENTAKGSIVPAPQGRPELYYVTEKQGGGFFTFEEAPGLARNKWINDQFDLFLDKKVKAARVKRFKR